jgi:hypothetical protein
MIHPRDYFVFPREGNETSDPYAGIRSGYQPVFPAPRTTHSLNRAGHSRTLYTTIVPEQSNIIFKHEGKQRTTATLHTTHPPSGIRLTSPLQDWL